MNSNTKDAQSGSLSKLTVEKRSGNSKKSVRRNQSVELACPRCESYNMKKDGHYRSYQKFFCKQCKRQFNDKTGTVFHYSHTPLKKWFLAIYLYFVLWPGCSTREISLELVVYTISKMLQIYQNSYGKSTVFIVIISY